MALEYGCDDVIRPAHQLERRENYRKTWRIDIRLNNTSQSKITYE